MRGTLRSVKGGLLLAASLLALLPALDPARAQYIESYFPAGVPGFDTAQGVTVLSRLRPLYEEPGVHVGNFVVRPMLEEGIGYDSNVSGLSGGPSSAFLRTAPAISANSQWSRNSLGVALSADNYQYFDASKQTYTNWTAAIGGGYAIGRDNLTVAYSHLSLNQNATDVGAVASDTPVHYLVDAARVAYALDFGRIVVTPNVDVEDYRFDSTTVQGLSVSQAYRDRVVLSGGVAARYALSDQRNLLFVIRGIRSHFTEPQPGQPTYNSTGVLALAGIDYQATGPWRYRLLLGFEERSFAFSGFKSHVAPIVEGSVIWTPSGPTTVSGQIARAIEDPAAEGNSGYTYTTARLVLDHELQRNLLFQGRTGVQIAQYLEGGGTQTSYTVGAGLSWLLNRNMRLSLDYNFTAQSGSQTTTYNGVPTVTSFNNGPFSRNIVLLAMHFGL